MIYHGPYPTRPTETTAPRGRASRLAQTRPARSACARCEAADRVLRGTGAGHRPQVASRDHPAVGVCDAQPRNPPSRATVLDDHRLVPTAEDPLFGPLAQCGQHGQQRLALVGQAVFESVALAAHVHALEDPVVDEML